MNPPTDATGLPVETIGQPAQKSYEKGDPMVIMIPAPACDPQAAPQCPSTTVDRATDEDTRCCQPEGHEGPHDDGCMTWGDGPANDPLKALFARMAAILGDKLTTDDDANFSRLLDMAERAQDFEDDFARVKAEDHAGDEVHCACVVHLRRRIAELEGEA